MFSTQANQALLLFPLLNLLSFHCKEHLDPSLIRDRRLNFGPSGAGEQEINWWSALQKDCHSILSMLTASALAKDSTLSVNIIHCFVLLFSFTSFFMFHSNYIWFSLRYNCGLVTELSLPFPSSCSCSDETETKILVEDSRPVLLHLRVPKCLLTVVISVLEWPIDFYIKVLVQIHWWNRDKLCQRALVEGFLPIYYI